MPRDGALTERPARRTRITAPPHPPVALIAEIEQRERIETALAAHGRTCEHFDSIEDYMATEGAGVSVPVVFGVSSTTPLPTRAIEQLRRAAGEAPVVLVCPGMERWEVRAALAAGVSGVVPEDRIDSALGPCLSAVAAGLVCVPRAHARQIEPPALSTREKQILGLVVMGYMNSQIAEQLFLAESTVKSHLSSAFGKLGVRSRNEAVNLILDSERGLGMGILALGGEPLQAAPAGAQ